MQLARTVDAVSVEYATGVGGNLALRSDD